MFVYFITLCLSYDTNLAARVLRPSQGFWGFREKGYLFSGIWGEGSFIFRDLGRFWGFREQGAGGRGKTFWGAGEKGHFSFREQGAKTPPGRASVFESCIQCLSNSAIVCIGVYCSDLQEVSYVEEELLSHTLKKKKKKKTRCKMKKIMMHVIL